jgi:hypothetical protein
VAAKYALEAGFFVTVFEADAPARFAEQLAASPRARVDDEDVEVLHGR